VLVLGYGRLVGKPVSILLRHNHAHVTVIDKPVPDLAQHVREAYVVISGVGSPALITPDMVGEGTVLIDAGTSESGGKIVGDIDPACAHNAKLFTPVPGGVGPVAIAMLFKNLLILAHTHRSLG
jgi:methylenetetrahydrofolate dehydrogenase (NADP+)/methenyltetrahydrofolate cyclohydrolase